MLKQTEEDADKEILEMKTSYEVDLKQEAESNVKLRWKKIKINFEHLLRGELGILKKKHVGVHKDLEEQKSGLHSMQVRKIFAIQKSKNLEFAKHTSNKTTSEM